MYIQDIEIRNLRSIREFDWSLAKDELAGWHVLIGDNGSGKSTILKAIALVLVGEKDAQGLRQNWGDWLKKDQAEGSIRLSLVDDTQYDYISGKGKVVEKKALKAAMAFKRTDDTRQPVVVETLSSSSRPTENRHVWGTGTGWFSVAYGPFRRFSGGNMDYDRLFLSNPKLAAHLSVFGEDVALSEAIRWLQDLHIKRLEKRPEAQILNMLIDFINQADFLPHQAHLKEISSQGVFFEDANGNVITVDNMSDGYRSILSMTFEIIRQLQAIYQTDDLFSDDHTKVKMPGVVLVDEIDAHLHPSWQRRIGWWFQQHFPQMQFIVTTHSPLVCQAADKGSVWKLPRPGSEEVVRRVEGQELDRLLYGNILEAYSTELFGITVTRSDEGKEKLDRLTELNLKEVFQELSEEERQEQDGLRAMLPTVANSVGASA